jgi:alpha-1,2-mannosyltransferase
MDKALTLPPDLARQRWFIAGLLLFFALLNLQYVAKIVRSDRNSNHPSAFMRWDAQLQNLDAGENVWAKYNYPNPPIMALILSPFTALPALAGALVWFYCKVVMAVLAIYWVLSLLDAPDRPFPFWGKVVAVLLSLRPIEGDLVHGNINLFILFLVVAALYAYCNEREWLAGLLLALSIACKVTPALFLPYFLWKRGWRVLGGASVGLLLFIWLIPGLVLGWQKNQEFLGSWWDNMVVPYAIEGKVTSEHQNQSLPGVLHRLLTDTASFSTYDANNEYVVLEKHNFVALDPRVVGWLLKAAVLLFAGCVVCCCRTPTDIRPSWPLLAEFSVVLLGMLLFSERTWKHHCVTLLLPFAVLCYCWSAHIARRGMRWYVVITLAAATLFIALTSTGLFDKQDRFGKLAQVYGAYVWAHLTLLACLLVLLGSSAEKAPGPTDPG